MKHETFKLGKGEPLLFLGGAFTTYNYNRKLLELLSRNYQVHFFNYPGFGKSEKLPGGHTLEGYVDTVDSYLEQTKLKDYHLAGSSFGGFLASFYVAHKENRAKSLVLVSPMTKLRYTSKISNLIQLMRTNAQKYKASKNPLTISIYQLSNFTNLIEKIKHAFLVSDCKLYKKDVNPDIPTLIVVGKNDYLIDNNYTKEVFRSVKRCEIVRLEGGHDAFATIGDKVLTIISEFTQSL